MALSDRTIRLQRQFFVMQLLQVSTIIHLFPRDFLPKKEMILQSALRTYQQENIEFIIWS